MNTPEQILSWAQSSERYRTAGLILDSKSFEEAQSKIDQNLVKRKERGDNNLIYYEIADHALWNEYQFFFLCQFLEFKTAELFSKPELKTKPAFILQLKEEKKANSDRVSAVGGKRILSPASLISDLGFNLGDLIVALEKETDNFNGKEGLISKLKDFNRYRVSFVHHSFNTNKKTKNCSIKEVVSQGIVLGKEVLKLL